MHRCGLAAFQGEQLQRFATGALASRRAIDPTGSKSLETEHFVLWYRTGNDSDALAAPWDQTASGDSVPQMVRTIAADLENAWRLIVDTLGMRPPLPSSRGFVIGGATPPGKYPVEFCRPERALSPSHWRTTYYGLTNPVAGDPERSGILLSSKVLGTGWSYTMETGGTMATDYRAGSDWLSAMRATAVHELQHATQFRYERSLMHFLFETSAVALEERVLPGVNDHLYYLSSLFSANSGSSTRTVGLLSTECTSSLAYRHGLYVSGLFSERGMGTYRDLWEDRARRSPEDPYGTTILATMRSILPPGSLSWRESLIRYGMRQILAGKRRDWASLWNTTPPYATWRYAAVAPVPAMAMDAPAPGAWIDRDMEGGELRFFKDPAVSGDLLVNLVADDGIFLTRLDSVASGFVRQDFGPGTHLVPAASRRSSWWILGSDGTSTLAANPDRSSSLKAHLSFGRAPGALAAIAGERFRYVFPSGQVLSGTALVTDSVLPVLDSGRSPTLDPDGRLLAAKGSVWTLSDARGRLRLRDARLEFPGLAGPNVFERSYPSWHALPTRLANDTLAATWSTLDLGTPRTLVATSAGLSAARMGKVHPNPSTGDDPIRFEVLGDTRGMRLVLLAADGALVRSWRGEELGPSLRWDLRNTQGHRVRPGVYTWILAGSGAKERGRLLIAR